MINLNKLYALREKIPKIVRKIIPKLIRRKINQKFFCYYFLPTQLESLPKSNYPDKESYEYQKDLIHKFELECQFWTKGSKKQSLAEQRWAILEHRCIVTRLDSRRNLASRILFRRVLQVRVLCIEQ